MHRTIFTFVLVLLLAACSILPLPQAAAVITTNPTTSITDTPQPTFTPGPTSTSTPIPEPFVIRDGALLAWDASLGEYQAIVLSNGALPEGAQIIENEIMADDGTVLYRFDAGTDEWLAAGTVPAELKAQIGNLLGEVTYETEANGSVNVLNQESQVVMWLVPTADGNWLRFTMDNNHLVRLGWPELYPDESHRG